MRISTHVIRSRSRGPPQAVEYLDLSNLDLVAIERINVCPKLRTLILRGNNIDAVRNLEDCSQLWRLDLSNNQVKSLEGLSRFVALGTLILSNNNLGWNELAKLRHMHILELSLHGNPQLEKDPYYRIHVIDCLPNVWMLDGRIITSAERLQVQHFFQDSALTDHPVRHKLSNHYFIPTSLKNIEVNGIFGEKAEEFMRRFPSNGAVNFNLDAKRLDFLAYDLQENMLLEQKYCSSRNPRILHYNKNFLQELLQERTKDRERGNMLLLLLVATLEFAMPTYLVKETLETAKLSKMGKVQTMDLFLLPRDTRCSLVSILLSAVKLDKDEKEATLHTSPKQDGGLYDRLYLCLYYTVSELTKLGHADRVNKAVPKLKTNGLYKDYRCLLASEVIQLLCIVPAFFEYLDKDVGVMNLLCIATSDSHVTDKMTDLVENLQAENNEITAKQVYEHVANFILSAVKENTLNLVNKGVKKTYSDYILTSKKALPRRPQSSPITAADFHTVGRSSPDRRPTRIQSGKATYRSLPKTPKLGEKILLGPQNISRIISLPQSDIALVQMDTVPVIGGSVAEGDTSLVDMVEFTRDIVTSGAMVSTSKNVEEHYTYIDMSQLFWDEKGRFWRPKGTVGDRITIQSSSTDNPLRTNSPVDDPPLSPTLAKPTTPTPTNDSNEENTENVITVKAKPPPRPMSAILQEKLDLKLELDEDMLKNSTLLSGRTRSGKRREKLFEDPTQANENLYDQVKSAVNSITSQLGDSHITPWASTQQRGSSSNYNLTKDNSSHQISDAKVLDHVARVNSASSRATDAENVNDTEHMSDDGQIKVSVSRQSSVHSLDDSKSPEIKNNCPSSPTKIDGVTQNSEKEAPSTIEASVPNPEETKTEPNEDKDSLPDRPGSSINPIAIPYDKEHGQNESPNMTDRSTPRTNGVMNGIGINKGRNKTRTAYVARAPRPVSAVEAYKFIVSHPIREEDFTTNYQTQRAEAWKRSTDSTKSMSRPTTPPPQRPSSPNQSGDKLQRSLNVRRGDNWLAGGRDLFWEDFVNRPRSAHIPGWKEGLERRPRSAAPGRTFRRTKAPVIHTPSSMMYESLNGRVPRPFIPDLPPAHDYRPSPSTVYGMRRYREPDHRLLCTNCLEKHLQECPHTTYEKQVRFYSDRAKTNTDYDDETYSDFL